MWNWDLLGTIFGRLYQIYIKMKNIPDIYWPGVFQYQGAIGQQMVHTPGSHLLTTNQTQIISKTRTHRSQQSILLQLFFATQCYTSGSEIWDLHAKLGLFWDQIWTLVPFGTKSQIWDFIIVPDWCRKKGHTGVRSIPHMEKPRIISSYLTQTI